MTEELTHGPFQTHQTFVDPPCTIGDDLDFDKLGLCVDGIKPVLGSTLEKRIHSVLEEFVCNSNSRYSKRFPCVKRCLDAIAAWADYLDKFCAKGIKEEAIKYAIEYLTKDGLVTQIGDSDRDNRVNRACQDFDSLTVEQNALKSMNVWSFISEKDYWLCQDRVKTASSSMTCKPSPRITPQCRCTNGNCSSDLNVEIGSSTKEPPIPIFHKRFSTCHPSCNQKIDNSGPSKPKASEDQQVTSVSKQNSLNPSKETPNLPNKIKHPATMKNSLKLDCNEGSSKESKRSPKLKVIVHRATSCSILSNPPRVTNLSLPCKSSHLIVRLFEADPSLSDCCLILMKRKFENDIRNACSCLNDIFEKLDDSTIKELRLNCQIRPGRIDLSLQRDDATSKIRLFLARVPTCRNVHKRESCHRNTRSRGSLRNQNEHLRCSREDPVADCCSSMKKHEEELQESRVAVSSRCLNRSLKEEKRTSVKEIERERGEKEVKFVWSRKEEREVDLVLSSRFTKFSKNSVVSCKDKMNKNDDRIEEKICGDKDSLIFDGEEGKREELLKKCHRNKETVDLRDRNDICVDSSITKDENKMKLTDSSCDCSSDSLRDIRCEDVSKEENSTTGGCNPEQCFCHVFCVNDTEDKDEQGCVNITYTELDNFREKNPVEDVDCFCFEEDASEAQKNSWREKNGSKLQENISEEKKNILQVDKDTLDAEKNSTAQVEDTLKSEKNVLRVQSSTSQLKTTLVAKQSILNIKKDTLETKESNSQLKENYSIDSISSSISKNTEISCDTRCSCCGKDLSDEKINTESNKFIVSTELDETSNLETQRTSNTILIENVASKEANENPSITQTPTFTITSNVDNNENLSSIHEQSTKTFVIKGTISSREYSRNFEKNSIEINKDHGDTFINDAPEISKLLNERNPDSLLAPCIRTNEKQFSYRSNASTDRESSDEDFRSRSREMRTKYRSSCARSTLRSKFHRKSSYSMHFTTDAPPSCPKNLRRIDSTGQTQCRTKEESQGPLLSRYKNRFWRGSIVPGNFCNSFPAIDRIKYLIRKKLRKLLLEERDKGTSTSKTYLKNDRYLVSISSGKLNEGRAFKEYSTGSSSIRCPFTTRNRIEVGGPQKTFTEGSFSSKKDAKKDFFEGSVKARCQRMIQGNDLFKKIRMAEISRFLGQKGDTKSSDRRDTIDEKEEGVKEFKLSTRDKGCCFDDERSRRRSSVASFSSTRMIFFENDDRFLSEKMKHKVIYERNRNSKEKFLKRACETKNFSPNSCSSNNCLRRDYYKCGCSRILFEKSKNKGTEKGDALRSERSRSFDKRLSNCNYEDRDEENDFVKLLSNYERRINDLDADFRLKLLQYVALCRSVKDLLMKRLPRSDDVYEVSSSSV